MSRIRFAEFRMIPMPARFLPKDIGADYVLGVARDAEGLETVVLYRLRSGMSATRIP